ncbi:hypothetical protein GCM10010255_51860 [Streptomyces coeruleofuscus]|uniref:Uncharacterized protein n=1 Tax=Streptomyces coeruleofuscus TaxID=66879 RepID=A0ABP5VQH8_9ACTN
MRDADEDAQPLAFDRPYGFAVHDDARAVHPLHHCSHTSIMQGGERAAAGGSLMARKGGLRKTPTDRARPYFAA